MANPNILNVHNPFGQNLYTITQDIAWDGGSGQPDPINAPDIEGLPASAVQFYTVDTYQEGGSIGIKDYTEGLLFDTFTLEAGVTYILTAQATLNSNQNPESTYAWYNVTDDNWLGEQLPAYPGELLQQTITPLVTTDVSLVIVPPEGQTVFKPYAQVINARAIIQAIGTPA